MNSKTDQNKMLDKKKYPAIVQKVISWKFLLGNYISYIYFLFNWCDNSICLVDAAGSHIQIRKFHQNMATENTSIEGFRGIVVNICLQWTQWIHQKTVFNRLFFFLISDKYSTIPLIWISTVLILMLMILVIYSIIQQHRYVYFIQLIFSVLHSLVHIFFRKVLDNIVRYMQ